MAWPSAAAREGLGADDAAGAAHVLDRHRLAEHGGEVLPQHARHHVRRSPTAKGTSIVTGRDGKRGCASARARRALPGCPSRPRSAQGEPPMKNLTSPRCAATG
jgi:hypothetical protein